MELNIESFNQSVVEYHYDITLRIGQIFSKYSKKNNNNRQKKRRREYISNDIYIILYSLKYIDKYRPELSRE